MSRKEALLIAEFALKYGLPAANKLAALFQKARDNKPVEWTEWEQVFTSAKKYDEYVTPAT